MSPADFQEVRQALGLTNRALARRLAVRPRTVYRWQAGRHAIPGPAAAAMRLLLWLHDLRLPDPAELEDRSPGGPPDERTEQVAQ